MRRPNPHQSYQPYWFTLISLFGLCLCAGGFRVQACSCPPKPQAKDALEHSDAVFVGVVRDVDGSYPIPASGGAFAQSDRSFRLEVIGAWKGVSRPEVVVRTGSAGDCGYDFVLGGVYLVYADRLPPGDTLTTNICTPTKRFAEARQDSIELGRPFADRSAMPWGSLEPGPRCPIHRVRRINLQVTRVVFGLPPSAEPEFRRVRSDRFPYAGLQLDRPPAGETARLRGVNLALVCSDCRTGALRWCLRHGAWRSMDRR